MIWAGLTSVFAGKVVTPPSYGRRDSSDAGALARSLYNAVSRHRFARAWGYFAKPPTKGFENFVRDYADTVFVDVFKGGMNSQGAAGSAYAPVAVAISYPTARATLKSADDMALSRAAPESCSEGTTPKEIAVDQLSRTTALSTI